MIQSKEDFKRYVAADRARYPRENTWRDWILHEESYTLRRFLYLLRMVEYQRNCVHGSGLWTKAKRFYYEYLFRKMQHKHSIYIEPNVCGPGLFIPHLGPIYMGKGTIGANCTMRMGMVVIDNIGAGGKKHISHTIGDNVEFGPGCMICCKKIGNNAVIAPNAVVFQNVPDNCRAVGNPAEIIEAW